MSAISIRQGDVGLEVVDSIPKNAKRVKGPAVIAYGEATGHSHRCEEETASLFRDDKGNVFLSVEEAPAILQHQEHDCTILMPGQDLAYVPQMEYTPKNLTRIVD